MTNGGDDRDTDDQPAQPAHEVTRGYPDVGLRRSRRRPGAGITGSHLDTGGGKYSRNIAALSGHTSHGDRLFQPGPGRAWMNSWPT